MINRTFGRYIAPERAGPPRLERLSTRRLWSSIPPFLQIRDIFILTSDRAGGFGGTDVYMVDVDTATGAFGVPRNAGPAVNSKGDEWAPTPTARGTLIFSSDGWGGAGKHDLFEVEPGSSGNPHNLGRRINGPDEDFDAAVSPDGRTLVFSSGTMTDTTANVRLFRSRLTASGWSGRERLAIGCSDFLIGAAFARRRPDVLFYSASCPGGRGRMDIHVSHFRGWRH